MNRADYIKELGKRLKYIPKEDRDDAIEYYTELISDMGIDENEDETVQIAAKINGTDEEGIRVSLLSRGRAISIDDEHFKTPIESTLNFAKEQGLITDLSYDDVVDTSYFENAGIE